MRWDESEFVMVATTAPLAVKVRISFPFRRRARRREALVWAGD